MATKIAGYVFRTKDKYVTARFYTELGLQTHEHQHGGPKHYEMGPLADDCVVELYQRSEQFSQDALMLVVDSISAALDVVARYNIQPASELREVLEMKFIYVTDPDGRAVMLIEKK